MNDLHKYATFSVDLLGSPKKINSVFSMGRARIFYKGMNQNRSIIEGEVAEQLASTIPGTPVIGTYNYETQDFEGHESNPSAFGFIPLEPHASWIKFNDREYLEVDVIIWDGRFEEAKEILNSEKHLSMELNPTTLKGTFKRIGATTYYNITYAEFAGITVLGDDVAPCFEDAQFVTAYSAMVSAYALYVEETQKQNEGGKNTMEDITEVVEPEVTTETVGEAEVVEEVVEETPAEVTEVNEETIEVKFEAEGEAVEAEPEVAEETEVVETVEEATEDNTEFESKGVCPECGHEPCVCKSEKDDDEDDEDEVCPECGKNPCVCENACNKDKDYSALEAELADCKAKYESLLNKYNETLNSLNKYTKKEKLEIISKFSTKLESEELINELTEKVDDLSVEEIKSELGQALVEEQLSAEADAAETTDTEANFSLNINIADNSLGDSAWDLVKRHKANK